MTSGSRPAPFRVAITFRRKQGLVLPDQLRTLDETRLVKRVSKADTATVGAVLAVLGEMFGE